MGFFDKLFGRKETIQEVVEDNGNRDQYGYIHIPRNDGSVLQIQEALEDGNQRYQTVIDSRTGEQISIPQYVIMRIKKDGQLRTDTISMELPAEALQDPQYAGWIANDMLSQQNIERVLNEQHRYAGGVQTRGGQIIRTAVRPGIVETLARQAENEKNAKLMENIRGMSEDEYRQYNAQVADDPLSWVRVLTPEMLNNRNGGQDR